MLQQVRKHEVLTFIMNRYSQIWFNYLASHPELTFRLSKGATILSQ